MNPVQHILVLGLRVYRWTLSPALVFLLGPLSGCRYSPTCSEYALGAIRTHGALGGGWLAVKRVCRCHPWHEGGHDPVPEAKSEVRGPRLEVQGLDWVSVGHTIVDGPSTVEAQLKRSV